ncbi:hypothetical protein [Alcanivorax nanhaiticus]|uniref:hypothetical protein n=1 Tax=Alcanivorax nanhaiticus TaxID=1177154 RepID=UPI0018CE9E5F|nr:hypothetical protein [Alcanivorax nanhaiticus]
MIDPAGKAKPWAKLQVRFFVIIFKIKIIMKNWTVKVKAVKKKDQGLIRYTRYLLSANEPSRAATNIHPLKDPRQATRNMLAEHSLRQAERRRAGLSGGGVTNYAQSYVFALPKDIPQPTQKQWVGIAARAVKAIANENGIDPQKLWDVTGVVFHEEPTKSKNNHIHVLVGNIVEGKYHKGLTQKKSVYASKQAFNDYMLEVLKVDNKNYEALSQGRDDPLWLARKKQAENEEKTIIEARKKARKEIKIAQLWKEKYNKSGFNELKLEMSLKKREIEEKEEELSEASEYLLSKIDTYVDQCKRLLKYVEEENDKRINSTLNRIERTEQDLERAGFEFPDEEERKRRRNSLAPRLKPPGF